MNLPFVPDIKTAAVVALVVGVAAFGGGWAANGWRLTSEYQTERLNAAKAHAERMAELISERDTLADNLAAVNDLRLAQFKEAQNETNRLRTRLLDGAIGLRLAGTCPRLDAQPQSAPGSRVDTGTGAELDATARRAYFALRDGIDRASAQLAACQDELRLRTE